MKIKSNKNWTTCLRLNIGDGSPRVLLINSYFWGSVPFYQAFFSLRRWYSMNRRIRVEIFISTWFREKDSLYYFNADYFCVLGCMASLVLLYWWKFREYSYSSFFTRITNQLFYSFGIICLFQQSMDLCDDTCTDKYILSSEYKW